MNKIRDQRLNLPRTAPVMVLPTLLFPGAPLPLLIFEPRYRAMLKYALERERMFCIALQKRGVDEWNSVGDFHHTAGLGLVRACVEHEDGTSHLVLQGLARVELTGFRQEAPFPVADLHELPSEPAEAFEAEAFGSKLLALCAQIQAEGAGVPPALDAQLAEIDNVELLADVVAHTFLRDPFRRQDVLEELRVGERMRLLIRHLTAEMM